MKKFLRNKIIEKLRRIFKFDWGLLWSYHSVTCTYQISCPLSSMLVSDFPLFTYRTDLLPSHTMYRFLSSCVTSIHALHLFMRCIYASSIHTLHSAFFCMYQPRSFIHALHANFLFMYLHSFYLPWPFLVLLTPHPPSSVETERVVEAQYKRRNAEKNMRGEMRLQL